MPTMTMKEILERLASGGAQVTGVERLPDEPNSWAKSGSTEVTLISPTRAEIKRVLERSGLDSQQILHVLSSMQHFAGGRLETADKKFHVCWTGPVEGDRLKMGCHFEWVGSEILTGPAPADAAPAVDPAEEPG